jgi:hypothetical protein
MTVNVRLQICYRACEKSQVFLISYVFDPRSQTFFSENLHIHAYTHIIHMRSHTIRKGPPQMRTTLVIPDAVFRRAKQAARDKGITLSQLVAESIEIRLIKETKVAEGKTSYKVKQVSMGVPKVDLSDREALYRAMEE